MAPQKDDARLRGRLVCVYVAVQPVSRLLVDTLASIS